MEFWSFIYCARHEYRSFHFSHQCERGMLSSPFLPWSPTTNAVVLTLAPSCLRGLANVSTWLLCHLIKFFICLISNWIYHLLPRADFPFYFFTSISSFFQPSQRTIRIIFDVSFSSESFISGFECHRSLPLLPHTKCSWYPLFPFVHHLFIKYIWWSTSCVALQQV